MHFSWTEYLEFIEDNAYERPELWLADAWAVVQSKQWKAPLYWLKQDQQWLEFTLHGLLSLNLEQPVCHISAYEADAFARWSECRLPTEFEWEHASQSLKDLDLQGQFVEDAIYHPAIQANQTAGLMGSAWQWTSSAYSPYPGFNPASGAIGEYNGKFMCNQLVLRGGSCVTSKTHIRHSYRNFFYPADRWQFSSLRLAKSLT